MSTPLLLIAIVAMLVVLYGYVFDESVRGGKGESGLFGMDVRTRDTQPANKSSRWKKVSGGVPWRTRRH